MFRQWKAIVCRPLKIVDGIIAALVVGITVFMFLYRKFMPEQVVQHWNGMGEIDKYADAGSYIALLIFMYLFWGFHTVTKLLPMFDIRENLFGRGKAALVTKEKEREAYNALFAMLWFCDLILQLIFAYIIVCGIFARNLGVWFMPAVYIFLAADFIWFFVKMSRIKKGV